MLAVDTHEGRLTHQGRQLGRASAMSNVERFAMGAQLAISRGVVHLESVLEALQGLGTRVLENGRKSLGCRKQVESLSEPSIGGRVKDSRRADDTASSEASTRGDGLQS